MPFKPMRRWWLLAGLVFSCTSAFAQLEPPKLDAPSAAAESATPPDPSEAPPQADAERPRTTGDTPRCGSRLNVARTGVASWYGQAFHGKRTANGERFDMHALTAAHKTLPFGTRVHVTDIRTGKEVTVRINDRGPHIKGRVLDLSAAAAAQLGIQSRGAALISYKLLPKGCAQ